MSYQAIVIAAGKGSRLGVLTERRPKSLLPLGDETIMERQLRLLRDIGVTRTTIVTGYQGAVLRERLAGKASFAENPHYDGDGNIWSLWAAREAIVGDTLILNCDLVYDVDLLLAVVASKSPRALAIDSTRYLSGHVRMRIRDSRPIEIGKHVPTEESSAAFLGVGLVRSKDTAPFLRSMQRLLRTNPETGWSSAFIASQDDRCVTDLCEYSGAWFDINSVATYRQAREYVRSLA